MNTNIDFNSYVKRSDNGSVDVAGTIAKFDAELNAFVTDSAEEQANIADAVNAVFDEYKGQRIVMPALTAFSAAKLNAQPSNMQVLEEKIADYVRSNKVEFDIGRGKGGGVARVSDLPAKSE